MFKRKKVLLRVLGLKKVNSFVWGHMLRFICFEVDNGKVVEFALPFYRVHCAESFSPRQAVADVSLRKVREITVDEYTLREVFGSSKSLFSLLKGGF